MAKADLMAVSPEFYADHKNALDDKNLEPIQQRLDEFYGSGCALFVDCPKINSIGDNHVQTKDGREFKVVNFHEINNNTDLSQYGFEIGKKREDLNFLVHMVDDHRIEQSLRTVDMLASSVNGGVLSESIISPDYNRTYCNRRYGVLLSQINANVVNMNNSNQGSGTEKDFDDIIKLVFEDSSYSARNNFKKGFLANLGLDTSEVSNKEFADFYKNNIVSKSLYSQFNDSKEYQLGQRKFSAEEIISAIKKYQNSLIDKKEAGHNEIVGYIPKIQGVIAKSKTLEEVPDELLNFAYENNLPVVLI